MRFNGYREAQLRVVVDAANERARRADVPANVTASSLIQKWIFERLDAEMVKLGPDADAKLAALLPSDAQLKIPFTPRGRPKKR